MVVFLMKHGADPSLLDIEGTWACFEINQEIKLHASTILTHTIFIFEIYYLIMFLSLFCKNMSLSPLNNRVQNFTKRVRLFALNFCM